MDEGDGPVGPQGHEIVEIGIGPGDQEGGARRGQLLPLHQLPEGGAIDLVGQDGKTQGIRQHHGRGQDHGQQNTPAAGSGHPPQEAGQARQAEPGQPGKRDQRRHQVAGLHLVERDHRQCGKEGEGEPGQQKPAPASPRPGQGNQGQRRQGAECRQQAEDRHQAPSCARGEVTEVAGKPGPAHAGCSEESGQPDALDENRGRGEPPCPASPAPGRRCQCLGGEEAGHQHRDVHPGRDGGQVGEGGNRQEQPAAAAPLRSDRRSCRQQAGQGQGKGQGLGHEFPSHPRQGRGDQQERGRPPRQPR